MNHRRGSDHALGTALHEPHNLVATPDNVIGHAGSYEYVARSPCDLLNVLGALFALAAVWPVLR